MILKQEEILKLHREIDTPALIVDEQQLVKNIEKMQTLANENKVRLRPHIKTHKSVYISKLLVKHGATGITVAKVGEAEIMSEAGFSDIFIANQVTHPRKLERLAKLQKKINISIGIDHRGQIELLKKYFADPKHPLNVLIEIDSGLERCGTQPGSSLSELAREIKNTDVIRLMGIFTHAGQVYGASTKAELREIGEHEGTLMAKAYYQLSQIDIHVKVVSVGSTPTVAYSAKNPVVNEMRPGNYVFYDNIQYVLGSCLPEQWALAVMATVISQPAPDRIVIDAGSKALNLDKGAHATQLMSGYGRILNLNGEIIRLSEEHGVIQLGSKKTISLGSPALIIPNHACTVANLYSDYHFIDASGKVYQRPVDARGMSQ
jgi:D-serine deaminase-like pyridoxal phosphate-dependent protein